MNKIKILSVVSFIAFSNSFSQMVIIVDSKTGDVLEDVNIFNSKYGTTSNNNGVCYLDNFDNADTIYFSCIGYKEIYLKKVEIQSKVRLDKELIPLELINVYVPNKKSRKKYFRLERNVKKVYPIAKVFSQNMDLYDMILNDLNKYSGLKRYYKKRQIFSDIEDELFSKYNFSLRKLTKSQGRILIRLIDRETDRTSYKIIKDFRSILSAGFWQISARVFGHNLKSKYNPKIGEDRLIELIIKRIEDEILIN